MFYNNDKNQESRKPAKNYRKRARAILDVKFRVMAEIFAPDRSMIPSEKQIEVIVDNFGQFMNRMTDQHRRRGFPVQSFNDPLTEEEMQFLESRFVRRSHTVLRTKDSISITTKINTGDTNQERKN